MSFYTILIAVVILIPIIHAAWLYYYHQDSEIYSISKKIKYKNSNYYGIYWFIYIIAAWNMAFTYEIRLANSAFFWITWYVSFDMYTSLFLRRLILSRVYKTDSNEKVSISLDGIYCINEARIIAEGYSSVLNEKLTINFVVGPFGSSTILRYKNGELEDD